MKIAITSTGLCNKHLETEYFRILLEAFGYPARIYDMGAAALEAVLLALCDDKCAVALEGKAKRAEQLLRDRHVPLVQRDKAEFIVCDVANFVWSDLPIGNRLAPEDGATLILEVTELSPHQGSEKITVKGAGIKDIAEFWVDHDTAKRLQQRPQFEYPCGVDLLLICDVSIVALPRHLKWELG